MLTSRRPQISRPQAVIYDHDGTLVDSLAVVVTATNAVLQARGLPTCPAIEIIKGMAYATQPRMGLHAGIADVRLRAQLAEEFYIEMHRIPHLCRLYTGVPELIAGVAARGLPQGMVSNNSGRFIRLALAHLGLASAFAVLLGEDDAPAPKPDPRGALLAAERLGATSRDCLFIGDSPADCQAAQGAGMWAVGVTWGIHDRAEMTAMGFDALIDQPHELLELLDANG